MQTYCKNGYLCWGSSTRFSMSNLMRGKKYVLTEYDILLILYQIFIPVHVGEIYELIV